ncbi:DC1 domain-containing protein [Senna tora]|uniref:DC1 domain-containing protein n=1 Tax=Senna tora TaxID=362788 RepID=A0A834SSL9_9FABA|nr:DC1 domain-containing protein [Senna tora]
MELHLYSWKPPPPLLQHHCSFTPPSSFARKPPSSSTVIALKSIFKPSSANSPKQATSSHRRSRWKVRKCCEIAGLAVQFVISAVLGDSTVLIAGIVGSLMSLG